MHSAQMLSTAAAQQIQIRECSAAASSAILTNIQPCAAQPSQPPTATMGPPMGPTTTSTQTAATPRSVLPLPALPARPLLHTPLLRRMPCSHTSWQPHQGAYQCCHSAARSTCQLLPSAAQHALQPTFTAATPSRPTPLHAEDRTTPMCCPAASAVCSTYTAPLCCATCPLAYCTARPHQVEQNNCTPTIPAHTCAAMQQPFHAESQQPHQGAYCGCWPCMLNLYTASLCCAACPVAALHSSHTQKGPLHVNRRSVVGSTAVLRSMRCSRLFTGRTSRSVLRLPALHA